MKRTGGDRFISILSILLVGILCLTVILPVLNMIAGSFSAESEFVKGNVGLIPKGFTLRAYSELFSGTKVMNMMKNTVFVTVIGTVLSVITTIMFAYPISKSHLPYRRPIMFLMYISTLFNPGIVPFALLVRDVGLANSLWSLIIPTMILPWNIILLRNFFTAIPSEIEDSAKIDGCNDWSVLFLVLLPLAMPGIVSIALFYSLARWNEWFYALILNQKENWTIQLLIREVLSFNGLSEIQQSGQLSGGLPPAETLKLAVVLLTSLPIMCVYPFFQKYFVEGVTMGAVKG